MGGPSLSPWRLIPLPDPIRSSRKPSRSHAFRALLAAIVLALGAAEASAQYEPTGCLSDEEVELATLINGYRAQNALPAVPVSTQLTLVAQWHNQDAAYAIEQTGQFGADPSCNLHSWYGTLTGPYTTCCYTSDHAQAACMWNKPGEISGGSYAPFGFENAAMGYGSVAAAVDAWKASSGHNDVILNQNGWASYSWQAMGVGVDPTNRTYFLWFAQSADPDGDPGACPAGPAPGVPSMSWGGLAAVACLMVLTGLALGPQSRRLGHRLPDGRT